MVRPTYILCYCGLYHPVDADKLFDSPNHPVTKIPWLRFTAAELDGMHGRGQWAVTKEVKPCDE